MPLEHTHTHTHTQKHQHGTSLELNIIDVETISKLHKQNINPFFPGQWLVWVNIDNNVMYST